LRERRSMLASISHFLKFCRFPKMCCKPPKMCTPFLRSLKSSIANMERARFKLHSTFCKLLGIQLMVRNFKTRKCKVVISQGEEEEKGSNNFLIGKSKLPPFEPVTVIINQQEGQFDLALEVDASKDLYSVFRYNPQISKKKKKNNTRRKNNKTNRKQKKSINAKRKKLVTSIDISQRKY
jgi:hypothetical protein